MLRIEPSKVQVSIKIQKVMEHLADFFIDSFVYQTHQGPPPGISKVIGIRPTAEFFLDIRALSCYNDDSYNRYHNRHSRCNYHNYEKGVYICVTRSLSFSAHFVRS